MWASIRDFNQLVTDVVINKQECRLNDFEVSLRKFKPSFISLLQNKGKNAKDRELIRKSDKEAISLPGLTQKVTLTQDFIDEALIVSDLFTLNEFQAVELLLAGEGQQPSFPDLTRGLVAVLLYYDSRNWVAETLRLLIQAREGRSWSLGLSDDASQLIQNFTDELWKSNLISNILDLLSKQNLASEITRLESQRALGEARHRHQFSQLYNKITDNLAECLLMWACQTPLQADEMIKLLEHIKVHCSPVDQNLTNSNSVIRGGQKSNVSLSHTKQTQTRKTVCAPLDRKTMHLLMTLLYSIDPSVDYLIVDDDEGQELLGKDQSHPIYSDNYLKKVSDFLETTMTSISVPNLCGTVWPVVTLCWSLAISQVVVNKTDSVEHWEEVADFFIERSIEAQVFDVVRLGLLRANGFHKETLWIRRVHYFITDLLINQPLRVKDLRNQGDEAARIVQQHVREGLHPPTDLRRDFEALLALLSELYSNEASQDDLLCLEFWSGAAEVIPSEMNRNPSVTYRQMSLFKFIRLAGNLLVSPSIYIAYIRMLTGLCACSEAANLCYGLLKANTNLAVQSSCVSWDHFFRTLHQYLNNLRQELGPQAAGALSMSTGRVTQSHLPHTVYQSANQHRSISPDELDGLIVVMQLIRKVALMDSACRVAIVENQMWQPLHLFFGLLSCAIPLALKAELMETLAVFSKSVNVAKNVWRAFESSQILVPLQLASKSVSRGLHTEIDETEPNVEEYNVTIAFLDLLNSLTARASLHQFLAAEGFLPVVNFVVNTIFLKHHMRSYKKSHQKWEIASKCLELFDKLVCHFISLLFIESASYDAYRFLDPGYQLALLFLSESPVFKMVMVLLELCLHDLELFTSEISVYLRSTVTHSLSLLDRVLQREDDLLNLVKHVGQGHQGAGAALLLLHNWSPHLDAQNMRLTAQLPTFLPLKLGKLLMSCNPTTRKADYLPNIVRFTSFNSDFQSASGLALSILTSAVSRVQPHCDLLTVLTSNPNLRVEVLRSLVDCLESESSTELSTESENISVLGDISFVPPKVEPTLNLSPTCRSAVLHILLQSLDQPAPNLGHFLLGFKIEDGSVSSTALQEAGVAEFPKTCLHSLLTLIAYAAEQSSDNMDTNSSWQYAMIYQILYKLAASPDTSDPTLRFLRGNHDFLNNQLHSLLPISTTIPDLQPILWNQKAWLLKIIAIELRVTTKAQQRSYALKLLKLLLGSQLFSSERNAIETIYDSEGMGAGTGQSEGVLISILEELELSECIEQPDWSAIQHFNSEALEDLLLQCEEWTPIGVKLINRGRLETTLLADVEAATAASGADMRHQMKDQLLLIPQLAEKRNLSRMRLNAGKQPCLEGWRQVVEVVTLTKCSDLLTDRVKRECIAQFLMRLLIELGTDSTPNVLRLLLSGTVLSLASTLAKFWLSASNGNVSPAKRLKKENGFPQQSFNEQISMLDQVNIEKSIDLDIQVQLARILQLLTDSINQTKTCSQRIRANLYGAMTFFLKVDQSIQSFSGATLGSSIYNRMDCSNMSVSGLDWLNQSANTSSVYLTGSVQSGELFEIVCQDAVSGHNVTRMSAIGLLDSWLSVDRANSLLLSFLNKQGYLQHFTESTLEDCTQLEVLIDESTRLDQNQIFAEKSISIAPLFLYQSKMALLSKIALISTGAKALIQTNVVSRFADYPIFSMRPPNLDQEQHDVRRKFTDTAMDWREILLPALRLSLNLLSSLGGMNKLAGQQVLLFLSAHADCILAPFSRSDLKHNPNLKELSLTSAILQRLACCKPDDLVGDDLVHYESIWGRLERSALYLLSRLLSVAGIRSSSGMSGSSQDNNLLLLSDSCLRTQIMSHLLGVCSAQMNASGRMDFLPNIIFTSKLEPFISKDINTDISSMSSLNGRPGLSLLIIILRCTESALFQLHEECNTLLVNVPNQSAVGSTPGATDTQTSANQINTLLSNKRKALISAMEHCCFLLWRHLVFYLQPPTPFSQFPAMELSSPRSGIRQLNSPANRRGMPLSEQGDRSSVITTNKRRADYEHVKDLLPKCLPLELLERVLEAMKISAQQRSDYYYVEVLVFKLKRVLKSLSSSYQ